MAAILYIKSTYPVKMFENIVPPIILKHQIYCVVKNKTLVDREVVCCKLLWSIYLVWYHIYTGTLTIGMVLCGMV